MNLDTTNYINSASYLPPKLAEEETFAKICDVIDQLISDSSEYFTYEKQKLNEVINKYRDFEQLDNPTIHQVVAEFGYQYIIDILELEDSEIKNIVAYLALINILKGSRRGLELVLSLLGLEYNIVEWFEDREFLPKKCTYALELTFVDKGFKGDFYQRFDNFTREYVYPVLAYMVAYFKFTYGQFYTGWAHAYHPDLTICYDIQDILVKYCDPAEWYMGAAPGLHPNFDVDVDPDQNIEFRNGEYFLGMAPGCHPEVNVKYDIQDILIKYTDPMIQFIGTAPGVHPEESILWDDAANEHVQFLQPGNYFYGLAQDAHPYVKIKYNIADLLIRYTQNTVSYFGAAAELHPNDSVIWHDEDNQHVQFLQPGGGLFGFAPGVHPEIKISSVNYEKLDHYTLNDLYVGMKAFITPRIKLEVEYKLLSEAECIGGVALGMHQKLKIISNMSQILEEFTSVERYLGLSHAVHPIVKVAQED